MTTQVVTQLIIDASGVKQGVADFEAAMAKVKAAAVDGGNATATSFETAQRRWVNALGATDPVIKQQIKMQDDMARQQLIGNKAVELGITTQGAAAAQLDKVRQKHEANIQAIREQTGQLTLGEQAMAGFGKATSGVGGQLIAMQAGAGPVGVFLAALGPWGVGAAAALGAAGSALNFFLDLAERTGRASIEMRNFADSTGFTIDQIRALKQAAAGMGIEGDKLEGWVQRIGVSLDDLRKGIGPVADRLHAISPDLLAQIELTRNNAAAWDVLAVAADKAGASVQNFLRGLAGRNSAQLGLLFGATDRAGGLVTMSQNIHDGSSATEEMFRHWADVQVKIDEVDKKIQKMWSSTFPSLLDAQLKVKEQQLGMVKAVTDLVSGWNQFVQSVKATPEALQAADEAAAAAAERLSRRYRRPGSNVTTVPVQTGLADLPPAPELPVRSDVVREGPAQGPLTAQQTYNDLKRITEALGPAATAYEQYELALRKVDAEMSEQEKKLTAEQGARVKSVLGLNYQAQQTQALVGALGSAAPASLIAAAANDKLNIEIAKQIGLSGPQIENLRRLNQAHADGTFALQAQIDATKVQTATIGMSVGAADTYSIVQTKINDSLNKGLDPLKEITPEFLKLAAAAGAAKQAQAELTAQNKATFDQQTLFLSDTDKQIAQVQFSLHGNAWKEFMSDGLSATMRVAAGLTQVRDAASSALSSVTKDLLNGTEKMQALANVAKSLRDTLIDMAAKQIVNATLSSIFGSGAAGASQTASATSAAAILTAGGTNAGAAMIAAATTAAGILAGGGATAGTAVGTGGTVAGTEVTAGGIAAQIALITGADAASIALYGPIALLLIAASAISVVADFFDSSAKKAKEAEDARKAADAAQTQSVTLTGGGSGNIQSQVAQTWSQTLGVVLQLQATKQWTRMYQLLDDFDAYAARIHDNFARSWQGMVDQLNAGLGDNGPFGAAIANVQQLSQQVQDFVDNTQFLTTSGAGAGGFTQTQVQQAQQAGQNFLLSLIQGQQPLSTVATELARINGTASALQGALAQLGLSATAAATAISQQVTQALDKLRNDTIASLTQRLNVATGQGFLNDVSAAVLQHQQDLSDAVSLGLSTNLVDQVFAAEVQKVVNDSGLVGDAFAALTNQFPALVGVVHEATAAVQDQATAQANLNRGAGTVVDYLNSLTSGPNAALSPQALLGNAQSAYNANLTLAQGGNVDAVNKFPQLADDLEKAAKAMFGSAMGYQDVRSQIISQGLGLPAVQQADDPVVVAVRDVLDAINAGSAAQATNATLLSVAANTGTLLTSAQLSALGLAQNTTVASLLTQSQLSALGLAANATVSGLLTAAQLAQAGLASNPTLVNTNTAIGTLLTQAQLSATGLASNATVGTLLTAAQLAQAGLATNVTTAGLLTGAQMVALGLASNTAVGALLTQSQLSALGLAANTTVSGLLTAAQLASAGLATNPTLVNTNTAIGTLLTQAQLSAIGLASNTTVGTLLTAAQLAQAGLATNAVTSGLLTQSQVSGLGLALNATAAGLLTSAQMQALGLATNTTAATIANSAGNVATNTGAGGVIVTNLGSGTDAQLAGNDLLAAIQLLNATQVSTLGLLNSQFAGHVVDYTTQTGGGAGGVGTTFSVTLANNMIDALNKIAFNTFAIAANTFDISAHTGGNFNSHSGTYRGFYAQGGTAPPFSDFVYGEHHPGGPFFGRAGAEPVTFSPGFPSNDNGAVVASVDRLSQRVAAQTQTIANLLARIAQLEERTGDEVAEGNDISRNGWDDFRKNRQRPVSGHGRTA